MERLRILAAATALNQFTASELVAFSGAKENTVRNVLHRERELFEPVEGEARRTGKGRPANLYRVVDPDCIRGELRELEERVIAVAGSSSSEWPSAPDGDQQRLAAIVVAEDAALRAWQSESPEEKLVLAETARASLGQAELEEIEGDMPTALAKRAESVGVFTALAEDEARSGTIQPELLNQAWSALADYADVVPTDRAREVMTCLADVAIKYDQLPPLAVLTESTLTPADAMPELRFGDWTRLEFDESREALWAQSWARPLFHHQLVVGLLVHEGGLNADEFEHSLAHVAEWRIPTVVISDEVTSDVVVRASKAGAFLLPATESLGAVAETFRSALANLNRYNLVEQRPAPRGSLVTKADLDQR